MVRSKGTSHRFNLGHIRPGHHSYAQWLRSLWVAPALFSLACTEGIPNFEDLGKSLNPPQFSSGTKYTIHSMSQSLLFEGTCDPRVRSIEINFSSEPWLDLQQLVAQGSDLNCSNGRFSISISDLGERMGFAGADGETKSLGFRFRGLPLISPVETWMEIQFQKTISIKNFALELKSSNPHMDGSTIKVQIKGSESLDQDISFHLLTEDLTAQKDIHYLATSALDITLPAGSVESDVIEIQSLPAASFYTLRDFRVRAEPSDPFSEEAHLLVDNAVVTLKNSTHAPEVSITDPAETLETTNASVPIEGLCRAEAGEVKIQVSNGGTAQELTAPCLTSGSSEIFQANVNVSPGTNEITATQTWETLSHTSEVLIINYTPPVEPPPEPASGLAWQEGPITNQSKPKALWTPSPSPGLTGQSLQLFSGDNCTNSYGSPVTLSSSQSDYTPPADLPDNSYSFMIVSISPGGETPSPCSPSLIIDTTPPTGTFAKAHAQEAITRDLPVEFTLTFSESIDPDSFTLSDINNLGSAEAITWSIDQIGETSEWLISVTGVDSEGSIRPSILAASVSDFAGNFNSAAISADVSEIVEVQLIPPLPATALGWAQESPTTNPRPNAQWTRSIATDLYNQKLQLYIGDNCQNPTGSPVIITPSTTSFGFPTDLNNNIYTFKITSYRESGLQTVSDCSPALEVDNQLDMILVVNTDLGEGTTVSLPLNGSVNLTVNWGNPEANTTCQTIVTSPGNLSCTYPAEGAYTIRLTGSLSQFGSGGSTYPNAEKVTAVTNWGSLGLVSLSGAFRQAVNLSEVAKPPSSVTDLSSMFYGASSFNYPIGDWDTSSVTNMSQIFREAYSFNQPIGNWNTSSVTSMTSMFSSATSFNQSLDAWDVRAVTDMSSMFHAAHEFNQPLGGWNTQAVTNMANMFNTAFAFNQDIRCWNVVNIPSEPVNFANSSDLTASHKPSWGTMGCIPEIIEFSITSISPTNQRTISLDFSTDQEVEEWCILFNDIVSANCTWESSALPSSIDLPDVDGDYTLSAWVKDSQGRISEKAESGSIYLDRVAPSITRIEANPLGPIYYREGDEIHLFLYFDKEIVVNTDMGAPILFLAMDNPLSDKPAEFVTYSDNYIEFIYNVQEGNMASPLDASSLELNNSSIQDLAGNLLSDLQLPVFPSGDSLAETSQVFIDTEAPTATISGTPTGVNSDTVLDVTVGGEGVAYYFYKIGEGTASICQVGDGYSDQVNVITSITNDISALDDGEVTLCVRGRDLAGNIQSLDQATSSTWTKQMPVIQNDLVLVSLNLTNRTEDSFTVNLEVQGDDNQNGSVTLYWCNKSLQSDCNPETPNPPLQGSVPMTRTGDTYSANVGPLNLPNFAGDQLNLRALATDPDGVTNNPVDHVIQLHPLIDIQQQAQIEGQEMSFAVTLNKASTLPVDINYFTEGDTAEAGTHFTSTSGTLSIPAGQTQGLISVGTINSETIETSRQFWMNLTDPINASIRTDTAKGFILASDPGSSWPQGLNGPANAVAFQHDGKRVIGGSFTGWDATINRGAVRILPDGQEDLSFHTGFGFDGRVNSWLLLPNGQYLAGGDFTSYRGVARTNLALLNADGSLDESFSPGVGPNDEVMDLGLTKSNKVLIAGRFTQYQGLNRSGIARIDLNGALDLTFDPGSGITGGSSTVYSMAILPNEKILIGGSFSAYNEEMRNRLARLHPNGALDTGFSNSGPSNGEILKVMTDHTGRILIGGGFSNLNGKNHLVRLLPDGSFDIGFNSGAIGPNLPVYTMALQGDDILIGGAFIQYNGVSIANYLARIHENGNLDNTFLSGSGFNIPVRTIATFGDEILVGGTFKILNGQRVNGLVKLDNSGAISPSFDPGLGFSSGEVLTLKTTPLGGVLVGGEFVSYAAQYPRGGVVRLHSNGSLDTSFDPGTGVGSSLASTPSVSSLIIQDDGRIILGGAFSTFQDISRPNLVRVHDDGLLDTDFLSPTNSPNSAVYAMALDSSVLYVGGGFTSIGGQSRNRIAALEASTGAVTSWNPNANHPINALAIEGSTVYVGGQFTNIGGQSRNRIASLDFTTGNATSWNPNANATVNALAVEGSTVYVGGQFTNIGGQSRNRIAALQASTGAVTSWNPNANHPINALAIANSFLYVGGAFTTIGGENRDRVAALDLITGDATSWNPSPDNWVNDVAAGPGGSIALVGSFTRIHSSFYPYQYQLTASESLSLGTLTATNITHTGFDLTLTYSGDAGNLASATAHYCNRSLDPACDPLSGSSQAMNKSGGQFTASITGLNEPTDLFRVQVKATSPSGVDGPDSRNLDVELLHDPTPPSLVSSNPSNGSELWSLPTSIEVTFSKRMKVSSITDHNNWSFDCDGPTVPDITEIQAINSDLTARILVGYSPSPQDGEACTLTASINIVDHWDIPLSAVASVNYFMKSEPSVLGVSTITSDGHYTVGSDIFITIQFDQTVLIGSPTPELELNTIPPRTAIYHSGAGTDTLTFKYSVTDGDNTDSQLNYLSMFSLTPAGSILGAGGTPALLALPDPSASGLSSANIIIDTIPPNEVEFSGHPVGTSEITNLNISIVGDEDVSEYQYKILQGGSSECSTSSGYSDFRVKETPITDDISGFEDGLVTLCAVGRDLAGNVQTYASASYVEWTKDTGGDADPLPPDPINLQAIAQSDSVIDLTWSSGGGSTAGFRVSYKQGSPHPFSGCTDGSVIYENDIHGSGIRLTGLQPNTLYSFRVCAINSNATPDVSAGVSQELSTLSPASSRVFVTSTTHTGNMDGLTGLSGADTICQQRANASGLTTGGQWKAILSDGSTNAKDRLELQYPIQMLDGTIISETNLWSGNILAPISRTEFNVPLTSEFSLGVWSGSNEFGMTTETERHCSNWSSNTGNGQAANNGILGFADEFNHFWINGGNENQRCNDDWHLYCIESSPSYQLPPPPGGEWELAAGASPALFNVSDPTRVPRIANLPGMESFIAVGFNNENKLKVLHLSEDLSPVVGFNFTANIPMNILHYIKLIPEDGEDFSILIAYLELGGGGNHKILKVESSGSLASSFSPGTGGVVISGAQGVSSMEISTVSDKIYLARGTNIETRNLTDGALDVTTNLGSPVNHIQKDASDPNQIIISLGSTHIASYSIASQNITSQTTLSGTQPISDILVLPDRTLVGGLFNQYDGQSVNPNLLGLDENGLSIEGFTPSFSGRVRKLSYDSNTGKLWVAGDFEGILSQIDVVSGSPSIGFQLPSQNFKDTATSSPEVRHMVPLGSQGKRLVTSGWFDQFNGEEAHSLAVIKAPE